MGTVAVVCSATNALPQIPLDRRSPPRLIKGSVANGMAFHIGLCLFIPR